MSLKPGATISALDALMPKLDAAFKGFKGPNGVVEYNGLNWGPTFKSEDSNQVTTILGWTSKQVSTAV